MDKPIQVLVAGRREDELRRVESRLREIPQFRSAVTVIGASDDPLAGRPRLPDVLILVLEPAWTAPLRRLEEMPSAERPPTLVVGPGNDLDMVRLAMRVGARDFLAAPADPEELLPALDRIASEFKTATRANDGSLTLVINAKGGTGASLVACNFAHMLTARFKARTVLVDLDLQFGVLPLYLDLQANDGLIQAIESVETLDELAVEGWTLTHGSGLHLLGSSHNQLVLPEEVSGKRVSALLALLKRAYDQVVVDLPRKIDTLFEAVVETADRVVVVLHPSLASLRHARSLLAILRGRYGVGGSQLCFVLNRWDETLTNLNPKEIGQALDGASLAIIPRDDRRASQSLELGTPLLDSEPRAPITRELLALTSRLSGFEIERKGLFERLISR